MVAGAGPGRHARAASSHRRSNDGLNAAQCSRSTARRSFSLSRAARRPQRPSHSASFHASRWWMPCGRNTGSVLAITRWSNAPRECSTIQSHSSSSTMSLRPSASTRAARESMHEQPRVAEVAVVGPAARRRLAVPLVREAPQRRAGVVVAGDHVERLLGVELGRREVADVLVDPVRHEGAGDARLPPRRIAASPPPSSRRCSSRR